MTLDEFSFVFDLLEEQSRERDIEILNQQGKPSILFGKDVPENLNMIDYGTYSDLCDALLIENHFEIIKKVCNILNPDVSDEVILNYDICVLSGYANWVIREIDRINKLFSSIHVDYTEQEKKAGIEKIQFGTFGILDWYARRMGIHDQNEVNKEKWVRIWQCMKNDSEETAFNRRLQNVYEQEVKRKH